MDKIAEAALESRAWPVQEAEKIAKRFRNGPPEKGYVLFQTGYGASGLPHIGTFSEVARTAMVRHAFSLLSDLPSKLICFSDDMDGLRKVPDNLPQQAMLTQHLGKPLTRIPDPFGTHESFGAHNNARLRAFLDRFDFDYEFYSATECYQSGRFDTTLLKILRNYDRVIDVILPTLGEERRKTYSPFLPICPKSGQVLQVPVLDRDPAAGTIAFEDSEGERQTAPVTGGHVKCQWKVDWAMRWDALDVDYEMSGKDLSESVRLSGMIRRILGGRPPEGFTYEMFLDEQGEKISKSKGNGLTIDEWLRYASPESLAYYLYQSPKKAKRLYFDVIPRAVDDYYAAAARYPEEDAVKQYANPAYYVHSAPPPAMDVPISFNMLLNLINAANSDDPAVIWGFVSRYAEGAGPESHPELDRMIGYAVAYYEDFVAPAKKYRLPTDQERLAMEDLIAALEKLPENADAETIMTEVYSAGKNRDFENLRDWFKALYEILFGQSQGPRMGSFIALYGLRESIGLLKDALSGKLTEK